MNTWQHIAEQLHHHGQVILLWVLESEGSSPGRSGFKMVVSPSGLFGTIGGGIMEHKLVERARSTITSGEHDKMLVKQYHDKEHARDRSGMICSGSQVIAIVPFTQRDASLVSNIVDADKDAFVVLNKTGLSVGQETSLSGLQNYPAEEWQYAEQVFTAPVIHIIGGGHVSLALSEIMHFLGFYIKVYDNRASLNTMESNRFADEKFLVDYQRIGEVISSSPDDYVVIMTIGYRDDLTVFKQLLSKEFYYLGMLGSEKKIETLFEQLSADGIQRSSLEKYFIPIGLQIFSKTPAEIAVSIAAEIIREKNRSLPTGRTTHQN